MTPRLVGYFLGMAAGSALFGAAISLGVEWILARFMARGPRSIAVSCFAAFIALSALLVNDPKLGLLALPAVALGCCIVWWLRLRSFVKRSMSGKVDWRRR